MPECLQKLLSGHPSLDEYLRRWERAEADREAQRRKRKRNQKASEDATEEEDDSGSNEEEVPEMMANLSAVALDGMDESNSLELREDKRKMKEVEARQRATNT